MINLQSVHPVHPTQFMLDLENQNEQPRTLQSFVERESDYDLGFYLGWKVFVDHKDILLEDSSHLLNLLDKIQKCALSHLPEIRTLRTGFQFIHGRAGIQGCFNYFGLSKGYCSDEQGIKDLIRKIWVDGENFQFNTKAKNDVDYYILTNNQLSLMKQGNAKEMTVVLKNEVDKIQETTQKIFDILIPLYRLGLCKNGVDRITVLNPMSADIREKKALKFFDHYLEEIKKAGSDKEIRRIISETMRNLLQLHLYWDGNSRSLYILANLLLHINGLSLSYPKNMCLFDANSVETMISELEIGQKRFKQMFGDETTLTTGLHAYINSLKNLQKEIKRVNIEALNKSFNERNFSLLLRQSASNSKKEYIDLLKYLLDNAANLGIDIHAKGQTSGTALDVATKRKNEEAITLLTNALI